MRCLLIVGSPRHIGAELLVRCAQVRSRTQRLWREGRGGWTIKLQALGVGTPTEVTCQRGDIGGLVAVHADQTMRKDRGLRF